MKFTFQFSRNRVQVFLITLPLSLLLIPLIMLMQDGWSDIAHQESISALTGILTPIVIAVEFWICFKYACIPCLIMLEGDSMKITLLKTNYFYRSGFYINYNQLVRIYFQTFRGEKVVVKSRFQPEFMILKSNSIFSGRSNDDAWKQFTNLLALKAGAPAPY